MDIEKLLINGIEMPAPKDFDVGILDLDSEKSKRNLRGRMHRDVIATKRKIKCEWGPLTSAEILTILREVIKKEFDVTYLDPLGSVTLSMHTSERNTPKQSFGSGMWKGLSFNLIEN